MTTGERSGGAGGATPGSGEERARIVVTIGTNYSGTTLLAMLMDSHPAIASVGECAPNRHARHRQKRTGAPLMCSCRKAIAECEFWLTLCREMNDRGYPLSADNWVTDYKYGNALLNTALGVYSAKPWVRRLQTYADQWLPGHATRVTTITQARTEFVRAVLRVTGKQVFFDTTKYVLQAHHMIGAVGLDLKFVRVIRDPRSFVASSKRRGHGVEERAHNWVQFHAATDAVLRRVPEDRVLTVNYDDLCRSPAEAQRALYAYCGVPVIEPPRSVAPQEHHVLGNTIRLKERLEIRPVESWRQELTAAEQRNVLNVTGPAAARLGLALE